MSGVAPSSSGSDELEPVGVTPTGFSSPRPAGTAALAVRGVSKSFPGTLALDAVDLTVHAGTVHGLIGGNGSGKSTLVKIISGVERGDPGGTLTWATETIDASETTPARAHRLGVRVVHQDLGVFPSMTVAENLSLGRGFERTPWGQVAWSAVHRRAQELIDRFEIPARPRTRLGELSRGAQTLVAIARALQDETTAGSLLILDEPTASLPRHEAESLMLGMRRLASRGQAILYISHRLDEISAITDEFTVLRDGRVVAVGRTSDVTTAQLVDLVAGGSIGTVEARATWDPLGAGPTPRVVLQVRDLAVGPVRSAGFDLHAGEVLGIAGLLGSGRSELLHAIFGDLRPTAGSVRLNGRLLPPGRTQAAMDAGLGLVPEDRVRSALFMKQSVAENLSSARISAYTKSGRHQSGRLRRDAAENSRRFGIKVASVRDSVATLSGGNQQKVVLGRWLLRNPAVLLLDEPTQGVDVGARRDIYTEIGSCIARGAGVVVVSSDLEELEQICHRVIILRDGEVREELTGGDVTIGVMAGLSYSGNYRVSTRDRESE